MKIHLRDELSREDDQAEPGVVHYWDRYEPECFGFMEHDLKGMEKYTTLSLCHGVGETREELIALWTLKEAKKLRELLDEEIKRLEEI